MQQQRCLKINFREIFSVVRFSTFATISARLRHADRRRKCRLYGVDRKRTVSNQDIWVRVFPGCVADRYKSRGTEYHCDRTVSVMSVACPRLTRSTVASHFTRALLGGNIRSLTIDAAKTDVAVVGSDPSGTASELACAPADARNEKVVAGLRSGRPMRYALTIFRQWGCHENEQIHCGHFGAYRRNYMLDTRESRV
jgi:hypothetical protein